MFDKPTSSIINFKNIILTSKIIQDKIEEMKTNKEQELWN